MPDDINGALPPVTGFGSDTGAVQRLLERVSSERLMATTAEIAKQERLSGSDGEYEAFEWIRDQLEEYGFTAELITHDAYISLPASSSLRLADGTTIPCIAHAFTASTPASGLTAPLIRISSLEAATRETVEGKIVLLEGRGSGMGTLHLEALGALGQIYVHGERMHETAVSPQWGSPTDLVIDNYPKTPSIAIREVDYRKLEALLIAGQVNVTLRTEVLTQWTRTPLLTADLRGESPEFVLLSCHVDAWHLGAMDNGSANATVMEVGRILASSGTPLRRSLRLAFWSGHSHGKYSGSAWYADDNWHELRELCVAHVNCDSTGGIGATDLTTPPTMPETHAVAEHAINLVTGVKIVGKRVGRFGDQSFLGIGIPSLYASLSGQPNEPTDRSRAESAIGGRSTTLGWWWHTPEDTLDKVDPGNLVRDTKVYLATVFELTNRELLPLDFRKAVSDARQSLSHHSDPKADVLNLRQTYLMLDTLEAELADFYAELQGEATVPIAVANDTLLKLARRLIPFRYHESSIFEHDWGGELIPVPRLRELRDLNNLDPGHSDYFALRTRLKRALNSIEHDILCAIDLVREARGSRNVESFRRKLAS